MAAAVRGAAPTRRSTGAARGARRAVGATLYRARRAASGRWGLAPRRPATRVGPPPSGPGRSLARGRAGPGEGTRRGARGTRIGGGAGPGRSRTSAASSSRRGTRPRRSGISCCTSIGPAPPRPARRCPRPGGPLRTAAHRLGAHRRAAPQTHRNRLAQDGRRRPAGTEAHGQTPTPTSTQPHRHATGATGAPQDWARTRVRPRDAGSGGLVLTPNLGPG